MDNFEELDPQRCRDRYPNVEWEFSPPYAPWTNGAIERIVGMFKRTIAAVMPDGVDEETFVTAAIKAEGLLNLRPITYTSNDSGDLTPICPANFLLPNCLQDLAPILEGGSARAQDKLRLIEKVLDDFWQRFLDEYIPNLNSTRKWHHGDQDLKINDVVVCLERKERRWPLGKIVRVFPNHQDGRVRTVEVLSQNKIYTRHVKNLVKLLKDQ